MKLTADVEQQKRIFFRLQKDETGYPPDDWESLWASEIEMGLYSIDNIPFFVRGISWGDIVSAEPKQGELRFKQLERQSGHSVLRIIVYDVSEVEDLRKDLQHLECDTEKSHVPGLIAVDVPSTVSLDEVIEFLKEGEKQDRWDYEEGSIRHP